MKHLGLSLTVAALALMAAEARADDVAILQSEGPFVAIPNTFILNQTGDSNVAGTVQTSALPLADITQTGFYNRAATVQIGDTPTSFIAQTGAFSRALVIQTTGDTFSRINQTGTPNSAITLQTGTVVNDSAVTQAGAQNFQFTVQGGAANPNNSALNQTETPGGVIGLDPRFATSLSPADSLALGQTIVLNLDGTTVLPTQENLQTAVANFLYAPETARAGVELLELDGTAFSDAVLGHLDDVRGDACLTDTAGFTPSIKDDPADRPAACAAFRLYGHVEYFGGDQDSRLGALGFDYDAGAAMIGGDVRITPELTGGIALRYSRADGDVADGLADIDVDSYGVAIYGDYAANGFFVAPTLSYSRNEVDIERPGFSGGSVGADPDGDTFGAAVRGGYLFDAGAFQVGPIAGLTYTHSELDGYAERGAFFLDQIVPEQDTEGLLGMAGIRIATEQAYDSFLLKAHADLGYEHDFEEDDFSVLETRFEFAPIVPIFTPIDELGDQDYMRVAAGLSFELPSKVALGLSAEGRVFGQERDAYRLAGELSIPF